MPEGHTVHRAARDQNERFAGKAIRAESPQGRFIEGAALIDERPLRSVEAYGKHLLYDFGDALFVHVHLGLFGKFRMGAMPQAGERGLIRLRLRTDDDWLELRGPTACEIFTAEQRRLLLARLGPDPLRSGSRPQRAFARIAASRSRIGALLMDQSIVAGIGNVYRCELLYRARIDPFAAGTTLAPEDWRRLWRDARSVMAQGVRDARMVTTLPNDRPHPRGPVRREERFYVYHRSGKPCRICGTSIRSAAMAARTIYWCPSCQAEGKPR
ncbi:MAG: Fpg/Nei family DNA glycosylase [Candidatus Velthaea sp.]